MAGTGWMAYAVLGGYLCLLLLIGLLGYRRSKNSEEDYYLAGRNQGWLVSSLTIMATFFSSAALLGAPGMVYKEGVLFALYSLNVPLSGAAVYFLGSKISRIGRSRNFVTPADMIADYYDSPMALRLLVALVGVLYAIPYVVMQIQAGGILSQQMFRGEYAFDIGAVVLSFITMAYIMIGGMRSVAWTDVVQGLLLVSGMLLGGMAAVYVLGGPHTFFGKVAELPHQSLSFPGTTASWTPEKLFTAVMFASLGSMIQPAQWMRYYSASSTRTLRRSAMIFAVLLTACFLFGVMLVGLGGQVLYPLQDDTGAYRYDAQGNLLPHPEVGTLKTEFDNILVVVIQKHLPELLSSLGILAQVLPALILVAIIAAAMSTADSNLHAMSAVLTRDVYDRFINPRASQYNRMWVGRSVIALATIVSVFLVIVSRRSTTFKPVDMITPLMFLAIGFSTQLLPITFDILYLRRGTKAGAIAGLVTGLAIVFSFSPFFADIVSLFTGDNPFAQPLTRMSRMMDLGAWGLIGNVAVFGVVSLITRRPDPDKVQQYRDLAKGKV